MAIALLVGRAVVGTGIVLSTLLSVCRRRIHAALNGAGGPIRGGILLASPKVRGSGEEKKETETKRHPKITR